MTNPDMILRLLTNLQIEEQALREQLESIEAGLIFLKKNTTENTASAKF